MSRGNPSMIALLGLLAYAGYQHRDKIGEMLGRARSSGEAQMTTGRPPMPQKSFLDDLEDKFAHSKIGETISAGLKGLMDHLRPTGEHAAASSWIAEGDNQPITPTRLEAALGNDTIAELSDKTGLTRDEILSRLSIALPEATNDLTPNGRLPSQSEAGSV